MKKKEHFKAIDTAPETLASSAANSSESRRSYFAPCIISAEELEAAAATCDDSGSGTPVNGKFNIGGNPGCQTGGS